eukprot:Pgem_evm2s19513
MKRFNLFSPEVYIEPIHDYGSPWWLCQLYHSDCLRFGVIPAIHSNLYTNKDALLFAWICSSAKENPDVLLNGALLKPNRLIKHEFKDMCY